MFTNKKNPRRIRTGICALLSFCLFALINIASAGVAHAGLTQWSDGFEGNPAAYWQGLGSGDGGTGFDYNLGFARSGQNNGWLYAYHGSSLLRIAVPALNAPSRSNCAAAAYMRSVGGSAQVSFQVWDPNGWHLIAWSGNVWINDSGYQQVFVSGLDLRGYSTIYIQAAFGNSGGPAHFVRVDDAVVQCYW